MDPVTGGVVIAIVAFAGCVIWGAWRMSLKLPIPKSPSSDNLAEMEVVEDPTQESALE
jgi:hypothetical protein